jgi:hypothetical protein
MILISLQIIFHGSFLEALIPEDSEWPNSIYDFTKGFLLL